MNDNFYYLGILYMLFQLISFVKTAFDNKRDSKKFINDVSKEMPRDMTELNKESIQASITHIKSFGFNKIAGIIFSILCLIYIIAGILYTQESSLYFAVLITSAVCFFVPIIGTFITALNSKDFLVPALMNSTSDILQSKIITIIGCTEIIIKISAIGFITYNHFFI